MALMWTSHGTHVNESWHTWEWVTAHMWMSHGTHTWMSHATRLTRVMSNIFERVISRTCGMTSILSTITSMHTHEAVTFRMWYESRHTTLSESHLAYFEHNYKYAYMQRSHVPRMIRVTSHIYKRVMNKEKQRVMRCGYLFVTSHGTRTWVSHVTRMMVNESRFNVCMHIDE